MSNTYTVKFLPTGETMEFEGTKASIREPIVVEAQKRFPLWRMGYFKGGLDLYATHPMKGECVIASIQPLKGKHLD